MRELDNVPEDLGENHVIYFGARAWCAPCKALHPMMDSLAEEYPDIDFVYIDVDGADSEVITEYRITSVPRVIFNVGGAETDTFGLKSKAEYRKLLDVR